MNKKIQLSVLFLFSVFSFRAYAQVNSDWKILLLDVAGHTIVKGVEVYSQTNTCNDDNVVYLKVVNHNPYSVTVKWIDAVRTQEQKWIKKENDADKKSITLEANKEMIGDCLGSYKECIIKLKDFVDKPNNFKDYAVYHFQVLEITK
jgi:hypothetical protein